MGVKVKTLKVEEAKLDLVSSISISGLVTAFQVPTYKDVQRIEGLLRVLASVDDVRKAARDAFFKQHNLPEDEFIDNSHPLFYEFQDVVGRAPTDIKKSDVAVFTLKEFNAAIDNSYITFANRRVLQFWLVNTEEK